MAVITLRVTDRIHDQIRAAAKSERVSMNQFCILAIHTAVTTIDADAHKRESATVEPAPELPAPTGTRKRGARA